MARVAFNISIEHCRGERAVELETAGFDGQFVADTVAVQQFDAAGDPVTPAADALDGDAELRQHAHLLPHRGARHAKALGKLLAGVKAAVGKEFEDLDCLQRKNTDTRGAQIIAER